VSEKIIEWNLGFARDEVVAGVEKLFMQLAWAYTRTETDAETRFQAVYLQGKIEMVVRPLTSYRSPFNIQAVLHRTMLTVHAVGLEAEEKKTLHHRLTLTFLRVGG
jgi:hypothetical protein